MLSDNGSYFEQACRLEHSACGLIQGAKPTQIAIQILGRHAVESPYPVLEPTVVGIHILDVIDTGHRSPAGRHIDRLLSDTDVYCSGAVDNRQPQDSTYLCGKPVQSSGGISESYLGRVRSRC